MSEMKSERITTMMTPSEVKVIDDWAFANRIRSRGEAIRRLIEVGLKARQVAAPSGGSTPKREPRGSRPDPAKSRATKKPATGKRSPAPKAKALPMSKEAQIRALREQGAG
jgi:hypothetical protein